MENLVNNKRFSIRKKIILLFSCLLIVGIAVATASANSGAVVLAGDDYWADVFGRNGVINPVQALVYDGNGNLYVGGNFSKLRESL